MRSDLASTRINRRLLVMTSSNHKMIGRKLVSVADKIKKVLVKRVVWNNGKWMEFKVTGANIYKTDNIDEFGDYRD